LWPGNVRELGHAIERAVLMSRGPQITGEDLGVQGPAAPTATPEEWTLEQAEKIFIQKVLARHGGDVRKAADQLGMSRSALYRRLQQFGL
jgi:DNA-binding NtrC family response regulator